LEQVKSREGLPFQYGKELEEAHQHLDEYTNLMKQELEEKEKKYAEMDSEVDAAKGITDAEEAEKEEDLYRKDEIDDINERFNEELQQQIDGTLPAGHIYSLGMPGEVLLSTGIANAPIQLNSAKLKDKSSNFGHDYNLSEIRDLVKSINKPVAIFAYGSKKKAQNLIIEIQSGDKNFVIGLFIRPSVGGKVLEINSIRNVFPKDNAEWLNWINQGKLLYVDKEKIQTLIDKQRINLAEVEYLDLDSVAKVVKDFENPKDFDGNLRDGDGIIGDDEISTTNDPHSKMLGRSRFSPRQRSEFASREKERMVKRAEELAKKLHLDNVEILTDASSLSGRRSKAKGFYNRRSGRITIVIPNHTGKADVERTLLHEAVAHYGLRELFGEQFDTFLDNVYQNAELSVRERIAGLASKRGWDFRTATEEYLAGLAEETDFENVSRFSGWWSYVKSAFLHMLHKVGFDGYDGPLLSDNELRYILWRSYENLAEPGRYRSVLGEAADISRQMNLKVGNYADDSMQEGEAISAAEDDGPNGGGGLGEYDGSDLYNKYSEYDGMTKKEISEAQYKKAKDLVKELRDNGINDFYISRGTTDHGVSTYIVGRGMKFRLSDHGVTRFDRVFGEHHIGLKTPSILGEVLKQEQREKEAVEEEKRAKEKRNNLLSEWGKLMNNEFKNVAMFSMQTWQNMDGFKQKHPNAIAIVQREMDDGKYSYEWGEKVEDAKLVDNGFGKVYQTKNKTYKAVPSYNYIETIVKSDGNIGEDIRLRDMLTSSDAEYMDAVNYGDMKKAERIVRDTAYKAGYTEIAWHGTGSKFFKFAKEFLSVNTKARSAADAFFATSNVYDAASYSRYALARVFAESNGIDIEKITSPAFTFKQIADRITDSEKEQIKKYGEFSKLVEESEKEASNMLDVVSLAERLGFTPSYPKAKHLTHYAIVDKNLVEEFCNAVNDILPEKLKIETEEDVYGYVWYKFGGEVIGKYRYHENHSENHLFEHYIKGEYYFDRLKGGLASYILSQKMELPPMKLFIKQGRVKTLDYSKRKFVLSEKSKRPKGKDTQLWKNIYDPSIKADHWLFYDSNQVKSADTITYDNNGNIIPPSMRFNEADDDIRYRKDEIDDINERFNEELQQQIDGTLPAGHIYSLGMPGEVLLSTGFPNAPIELSSTRLLEKSKQENHLFDLSGVKDLVKELNHPWAVFRYGNNAKNVIVGIEHNGKQFLVGVHFNQTYRGLEVSDIRGIFPKDNAEWLNWISQGKADYLDKEKIQTLIDQQRTNLADVEYLDLDSVAKVVKDFENPNISEKKISEDEKISHDEFYRDGDWMDERDRAIVL